MIAFHGVAMLPGALVDVSEVVEHVGEGLVVLASGDGHGGFQRQASAIPIADIGWVWPTKGCSSPWRIRRR